MQSAFSFLRVLLISSFVFLFLPAGVQINAQVQMTCDDIEFPYVVIQAEEDVEGVEATVEVTAEATVEPEPEPLDLAGAIDCANAKEGIDSIILGSHITMLSALPAITDDLSILGAGFSLDATGNDSGISIFSNEASLTLLALTIQGNNAGAIVNAGDLTVMNTIIIGNSALGDGAAISNIGGRVAIVDSIISQNEAGGHGGAIYNSDGGTVTITNSIISDNHAGLDGGGIANLETGVLTALSSTISDNHAELSGNGIYNEGTVTLLTTTISRTITEQNGQVLAVPQEFIGGISSFENNHDGGGLYNSGVATILDSSFTGNRAPLLGSGIYNTGTLTITNTLFNQNFSDAPESGGGAIFNGMEGVVTVDNSIFDSNASSFGAAIYNMGYVSLSDGDFANNSAAGNAGAIYSVGSLEIADTTFENNNAATVGGAIVAQGIFSMTGGRFEGNTSQAGGGAIAAVGQVDLRNLIFIDNSSVGPGGAIIAAGSNSPFDESVILVSNSLLVNNRSDFNGGAIYAGGNVYITNSTFTENSAIEGSAVYNLSGFSATISNTIIWNDSIAIEDNSDVNINYSIIQGGFDGDNNLDVDPEFLDPEEGDYSLGFESPAIDAGSNRLAGLAGLSSFDFDIVGEARFSDHPFIEDTGDGAEPVIDIGAYEFDY